MLSDGVRQLPPLLSRVARVAQREARVVATLRRNVICPICRNRFRFLVVNTEGGRFETLCLRCMSLERHRRTVLLLRRCTPLYRERLKVLHVAPEASLRAELGRLENLEYLTGDLMASGVDVQLDLTDVRFPDCTFDVVLCSHVLEHIPDDRRAMREMHRILKPSGWALINVPADPARTDTYEDPSVVDPDDRLKHFGQRDHVRIYGMTSFLERLRAAGFSVEVDPLEFTAAERARYMLDGDIGWDHSYLCTPART